MLDLLLYIARAVARDLLQVIGFLDNAVECFYQRIDHTGSVLNPSEPLLHTGEETQQHLQQLGSIGTSVLI